MAFYIDYASFDVLSHVRSQTRHMAVTKPHAGIFPCTSSWQVPTIACVSIHTRLDCRRIPCNYRISVINRGFASFHVKYKYFAVTHVAIENYFNFNYFIFYI